MKSKLKQIFIALVITFVIISCNNSLFNSNTSTTNIVKFETVQDGLFKGSIIGMELPKIDSTSNVKKRTGYTINYSNKHKQAVWAAYPITKKSLEINLERKDSFRKDPDVENPSTLSDYKKSGYDRGHLAPNAALNYSKESMRASFLLSNMSPQKPYFNRGIWKNLESNVRSFAKEEDVIYVVTGPILKDDVTYNTIGPNKVTVPKYYYKVILKFGENSKAIGFILPNQKSDKKLHSFVKTIDEVEDATGIDFFPLLPDNIENKIEAEVNPDSWVFKHQ